jgi:hypothetical protein
LNHAINRRLEEMADTAKDTAGRNVSEGEDTADGG